MSHKTFMLLRVVGIIVVATLGAWLATTDNALILIPVVIAVGVIFYLLRRRVKEVVADERIYSIGGKASWLALRVFIALAVIVGATLIAAGRYSSPELSQIGLALAYSVCTLLIIYWISYLYYNRKLGGRE